MDVFVSHLKSRGISLWLENNELRYKTSDVSLSAEILNSMKSQKQQLIGYITNNGPIHGVDSLIPKSNSDTESELSVDQGPLKFLDELRQGSISDHLSHAYSVHGSLHKEHFQLALESVALSQPALRTVFSSEDKKNIQKIDGKVECLIEFVSAISATHISPDTLLSEYLKMSVQDKFNLSQGPLFRVKIVELSPDHHVVLFVLHHLIADGFSFSVLFSELNMRYESLMNGKTASMPQLTRNYFDYVAWRNETARTSTYKYPSLFLENEKDHEYHTIDFPIDYSRPAIQSVFGARAHLSFEPCDIEKMRGFCKLNGISLFMLFLAAHYLMVSRYTGEKSVCIGTPVSTRDRSELLGIIGMFVNMSVVGISASAESTVAELLQNVKRSLGRSLNSRHVPFTSLIEKFKPERDLSRNPLFQSMIQLSQLPELKLANLQIEYFDFDPGISQFDFSIHLFESENSTNGFIEYDSEIFSPERISRMISHFKNLTMSIVDMPSAPISSVQFLSSNELELYDSLNDTTTELLNFPNTVIDYFNRQVLESGADIAVYCDGELLTYEELDKKSNQIANYLITRGFGAEELCGVHMDRSVEMIIVLLGILKSGVAYLPLDPSFPQDRLLYMLDDCDAKCVFTNLSPALRLNSASVEYVEVGECLSIPTLSMVKPENAIQIERLAYMIYTSGSTGRPKGVQILHSSLTNFLQSMSEKPGLEKHDRLLAVTTLSFDISVLEIFLPLVVGAQLHLATKEETIDGSLLYQRMLKNQITAMQATPSTWLMLDKIGISGLPPIKKLCGGEPLPLSLARNLLEKNGGSLWNMYGPTETTIWSSIKNIDSRDTKISLGYPINNTQFYVVDSNMNLQPIGVPGELLIGGKGLAVGYWNRPELNSQKYVKNPFPAGGSAKLYRTGDLVKLEDSLDIEFLGRIDHQIKLRGFRIELGEITSVLKQHDQIEDALTKLVGEDELTQKLVSYVTGVGTNLNLDSLNEHIREKLPSYMVPSIIMPLATWPLTPNGKIDHKSLPAPVRKQSTSVESTDSEDDEVIELKKMWQDLLKIDSVNIVDNFFDLGGHSLLVVEMRNKINEHFGVEVKTTSIFANPTIKTLAVLLQSGGKVGVDTKSIDKRSAKQSSALQKLKLKRRRKG